MRLHLPALALVVTLALPFAARADAMLVSGHRQHFPAAIAADVTIHAQVESTTYRFDFGRLRERATYTLTVPAPLDAAPIGVDVDRGDGLIPVPVIVGAPPAAAGGTSDAALAAWAGTTPLVATLEDLGPGPLVVRVRFVRVLRRVGGEVAFDVAVRRCPARDPGAGAGSGSGSSATDGPPVTLRLRVDTARDLAGFDVDGGTGPAIAREARRAVVTTAVPALVADEVVHVRYREAGVGIHAQLVSHRTPTADPLGGTAGYFLLLVDSDDAQATTSRTLSLVLDRSGSMVGDKLAQARAAAHLMLDQLTEADHFALHAFDDEVGSFRAEAVAATPANLALARTWLDHLEADALTNLDGGLAAGLTSIPEDRRFDAVLLLSDGVATAGVTDAREIVRRATARAAEVTRIYTVSIGSDADYPLMEALARHNRGRHLDLDDRQATHDLARRVRELVEDLRAVRLTDLRVSVDGVGAELASPASPPDLFAGGQVLVIGRYTQPGTAAIRITGRAGDAPFAQTFLLEAPALAPDDDVLRQVWAAERVRVLMAGIATGADPEQVRAAVEDLGLAYRIQTPYTRFAGGLDDPAVTISETGCAAGGAGRWGLLAVALAILALSPRPARRRRR